MMHHQERLVQAAGQLGRPQRDVLDAGFILLAVAAAGQADPRGKAGKYWLRASCTTLMRTRLSAAETRVTIDPLTSTTRT